MSGDTPKPIDDVNFLYKKSNLFRVIHVMGAHGGVTPQNSIQMTVYTERLAIPKNVTYKVLSNGALGDVVESKSAIHDGLVREAEATLMLDTNIAQDLIAWLQKQVETIETRRQQNGEGS